MVIFPVFGVVELGLMLLSVGLSILAGYLLKKKVDNPIQDEKPTQLATRGSFCAWLLGIQKVGPIFCWVGNRVHDRERSHGGKGDMFGSTPKVDVWYEDGLHVLCVGTVTALHQIIANGEVLFQGPITNESHPSGSLVDCGHQGSFYIYWGEEDQPENTWLGSSARLGVSSQWPCFCYIVWVSKKLGSSTTWPMLEYVIERRPQEAILADTDAWHEPTESLSSTATGVEAVNNGVEGVGYILLGEAPAYYYAGTNCRMTGDPTLPDQDFEVLKQEYVVVYYPSKGKRTRTKIYPVGGISGASGGGFLNPYDRNTDDGVNPAHIMADLLFAEWPYGLGLDQSQWDLDSLESVGETLEDEEMHGHLLAASGDKGESAEALLGSCLQDMGCMIPVNTASGKVMFRLVREPSVVQTIPEAMLLDLPEIDVLHERRPCDRIIFSFLNRDVGFREMTFVVADDGQAEFLQHQTYQKVTIKTTSNTEVAAKIAQRRGQEELGNGAVIRLGVGRAARSFIPGDVYYVTGLPEALRVSTIKIDTETNKVEVGFITDFYGVPLSSFVNPPSTIDPGILPVGPDLANLLVEVPEYLLNGDPQTVLMARIRAHAQIYATTIHLSQDDASYSVIGSDMNSHAGGTLDAEFSADTFYYLDQGPVINVLGPDIAGVQDLSGDLVNWALGRQVVFINGEIFFLQKVTALGGDQYRLDGLLRARYDTHRETHDEDDFVFIMTFEDAYPIQDLLLAPEQTIYAKSQPQAGGVMPLSGVAPVELELYGKGVRPIPVSSLHVTDPHLVDAYGAGDDVTVEWAYAVPSVPGLGAGMQAAGTAVGTPDPEGSFLVELLTTADVLVRAENVTTNSYTYTNSNIIADLGSEVSFKVRVTQLRNGYSSDTTTITVEKI